MIPDPPRDADGDVTVFSYHISAALAFSIVGECCICGYSCAQWWCLDECGMAPVTDRCGALTDEVPLHDLCIPGLLEHWATLIHGGDPEDSPEPVVVDAPRRGPSGAYARRLEARHGT